MIKREEKVLRYSVTQLLIFDYEDHIVKTVLCISLELKKVLIHSSKDLAYD